MYFHTDEDSMVEWLANVFTTAANGGRRVRIDVTPKGELKLKVGEGMWTHPFPSTRDPYRDEMFVAEHFQIIHVTE